MLLWEKYRQREPDGYRYSRWCELYRAWESRLSPTMPQVHPAGERMFVDYAGQTMDLTDGRTGEMRPAQIFVAVMGAASRCARCSAFGRRTSCSPTTSVPSSARAI
jgi:transposase